MIPITIIFACIIYIILAASKKWWPFEDPAPEPAARPNLSYLTRGVGGGVTEGSSGTLGETLKSVAVQRDEALVETEEHLETVDYSLNSAQLKNNANARNFEKIGDVGTCATEGSSQGLVATPVNNGDGCDELCAGDEACKAYSMSINYADTTCYLYYDGVPTTADPNFAGFGSSASFASFATSASSDYLCFGRKVDYTVSPGSSVVDAANPDPGDAANPEPISASPEPISASPDTSVINDLITAIRELKLGTIAGNRALAASDLSNLALIVSGVHVDASLTNQLRDSGALYLGLERLSSIYDEVRAAFPCVDDNSWCCTDDAGRTCKAPPDNLIACASNLDLSTFFNQRCTTLGNFIDVAHSLVIQFYETRKIWIDGYGGFTTSHLELAKKVLFYKDLMNMFKDWNDISYLVTSADEGRTTRKISHTVFPSPDAVQPIVEISNDLIIHRVGETKAGDVKYDYEGDSEGFMTFQEYLPSIWSESFGHTLTVSSARIVKQAYATLSSAYEDSKGDLYDALSSAIGALEECDWQEPKIGYGEYLAAHVDNPVPGGARGAVRDIYKPLIVKCIDQNLITTAQATLLDDLMKSKWNTPGCRTLSACTSAQSVRLNKPKKISCYPGSFTYPGNWSANGYHETGPFYQPIFP